MKVVYCDRCHDVSIKSNFEIETCNRCNQAAVRVPYRRSWHYYASLGILLTAVLLIWAIPADVFARLFPLLGAIAAALALTSWPIRSLRSRVLREMRTAKAVHEGQT